MAEWRSFIRDVQPGDIDALIELFRASVRQIARRDYSRDQVLARAPNDIDSAVWVAKYRKRAAWVVDHGGVISGFSDLEADGHLDMMYVRPGCERRGIATALLNRVEMEARILNLRRLFTEASITGRPFFDRGGFRLVAPQTVRVRGQEFINYRMDKRLE